METRRLDSGAEMPVLGLGVWQLGRGRETEQAVEWAFEAGYRHIDTAMAYRNEESVGAAIRRSGLAREDVFVTTKILPTHRNATRQLEHRVLTADPEEVVGRLELAVADDVHVALEAEAERLVEGAALLRIRDPNHRVEEFGDARILWARVAS